MIRAESYLQFQKMDQYVIIMGLLSLTLSTYRINLPIVDILSFLFRANFSAQILHSTHGVEIFRTYSPTKETIYFFTSAKMT